MRERRIARSCIRRAAVPARIVGAVCDDIPCLAHRPVGRWTYSMKVLPWLSRGRTDALGHREQVCTRETGCDPRNVKGAKADWHSMKRTERVDRNPALIHLSMISSGCASDHRPLSCVRLDGRSPVSNEQKAKPCSLCEGVCSKRNPCVTQL